MYDIISHDMGTTLFDTKWIKQRGVMLCHVQDVCTVDYIEVLNKNH